MVSPVRGMVGVHGADFYKVFVIKLFRLINNMSNQHESTGETIFKKRPQEVPLLNHMTMAG